ncbi:MAG: hypothetical protein GY950_15940 [bacterium]|nr:hypothetical protein [bacterium]
MDKSKFNIKREWRNFGIALGIILAIVASIMLYKGKALYIYFYGGGGFFILAALTVPIIIKPVFIFFLYLAHVMGWVMTRVILCILFYLVLTPTSFVAKLFRKRFLDLKFSRKEESYWIETDKSDVEVENYEKQF